MTVNPLRTWSLAARLAAGLVLGAGAVSAVALPAQAQQMQRIAAVVNDQVISLYDLQARLELSIRSSQLPDTPETRQRLLPTILQQLVDERLKLQEAARQRVTVTDDDLRTARRQVERNNNMPPGTLDRFLTQPGIDENSFNDQLRAEIAWIKVAQNVFRRSVGVEPEEVDAVLDRMRRDVGKPERLLAEIVLPVDDPGRDEQVRSVAERLRAELLQGAPFQAVARQFSAAPTAATGGDLGWVVEGSLDPDMEAGIAALQAGQVSQPIRTASGYHLVLVRQRRDPTATAPDQTPVTLSQLYMPLRGPAAVPADKRAEAIAAVRDGTCADIDAQAEKMQIPSSGAIGTLKPADLPPPIRDAVMGLEPGRLSDPIPLGDAEVVVMVCQRHGAGSLPSREAIESRLENEKLERVAQRALRNLRRSALIDIRL
ncbi:peptidylprolyl isomerase [Novispirillum sp. DQ9]|uniref:peptidylprolyl isomerase n=1 Tax=Novispirillum sp. DQ9 TaxID=3398612 RepID=UPI003C7D66F9